MPSNFRRILRHSARFASLGAIAASLTLAFIASAQQPKPAATKEKTAEEVYKNIKSLKGQAASQVIPTMQFMSSSLGVECEFCHDVKAFDKDTKDEKVTAREMIAMQEGINRSHFKGKREVTCNSCHHGAQHPAGVPALPELNAVIAEPEHEHGAHKPPQLASPTEYLDEYYKAAGGEELLAKITSRTEHGSVTYGNALVQGPVFNFENSTRSNGQRSTALALKEGIALTVFNGHTGWLVYPGRHTREMSSGEAEATRVEADFEFPLNFKQRYTQFRAGRPEVVNGKQANVLQASRPGEPPVRLYFDQASHLLIRVLYYVETPLGRNPTQIDVTSYADASGVAMPQHWIVTRPASRATYIVAHSDNATPIDDGKFAQPAPTGDAAH
jgi:hypothetical protein